MRFRLIDGSNIGDHACLAAGDQCFYIFEYTSGKNYKFSTTNNLISNLKKKPSKKLANPQEYRYKEQAISECSACLGKAIDHEWLKTATLVPVPPSKAKNHPEYDDRMVRICEGVKAPFPVDVRELVVQRESTPAQHESPDEKISVDELVAKYEIDGRRTEPAPSQIAIVDDVLTAGKHFKAMSLVLQRQFPGAPIFGFFIARRVFPDEADM